MIPGPTDLRVALHLIDPPENPSRETIDPERVGALADDIAANGLLQPMGVTGPDGAGRYRIAYGHRRLLALELLKWRDVTVKCWPAGTDVALLRVSENNIREQLTPLEQAAECRGFLERGVPVSGIARLFRRSHQWVLERLELLELPDDVRLALNDGGVSMAVARVLGGIDHDAYRAQLIAEARRTGANGRTVEVWAAHYQADRERIISNHLAVEEIVRNRDNWKIMVPCELCAELCDYPTTRTLRACLTCMDALAQVIADQARAAQAAGDPDGA